MKFIKCVVVLLALACIAMFAAGCTSSKSTTTPTVPAATPAAGQPAVLVTVTTPACPDNLVWDGAWDTRWVSEGHDVMDSAKVWIETGKDDPTGPGPYPVILSQKCRDVTGTYSPGTGTITARVEGNQMIGTYNWVGTTPTDTDHGAFTLSMAADNKTWVGYAKSYTRGDYNDPNNWYGKKTI
jgi:hypothetical protein